MAIKAKIAIVADRFFAGSKTCSNYGHKLAELPPSVRKWQCPDCGKQQSRLNATWHITVWTLWRIRLWSAILKILVLLQSSMVEV
ncbi:MAG: transposase [Holophagales bacterium]|nr:transposase [Holophagales bacterium]